MGFNDVWTACTRPEIEPELGRELSLHFSVLCVCVQGMAGYRLELLAVLQHVGLMVLLVLVAGQVCSQDCRRPPWHPCQQCISLALTLLTQTWPHGACLMPYAPVCCSHCLPNTYPTYSAAVTCLTPGFP